MPNFTRRLSLSLAGATLAAIIVPLSLTAPADAGGAGIRPRPPAVVQTANDSTPSPSTPSSTTIPTTSDEIAKLRAKGPAALEPLLRRYDALHAESARAALGKTIDAVAGQRYATVSRLFWYTDLDAAKLAAKLQGKPILSLRMLGRLDEDRSCANSRFFRATLYANAKVSKLLRDRFVLHWSTERAVPQVTIDMGDGRKIETTTTGNSAHYVLDERGRVLDVLPGLYAPVAFEAELGKSLAFANSARGLSDDTLRERRQQHHLQAMADNTQRYGKLGQPSYIVGGRRLLDDGQSLMRAQQATMMKSRVEVPVLAQIGKHVEAIPEQDISQWAAIGRAMWKIDTAIRPRPSTRTAPAFVPQVLDEQSVSLVTQLHLHGQRDDQLVPAMLSRLEHDIVADTALNELRLRAQIRGYFASGALAFEQVNEWVYANVFHTPRHDAWLGLVSRRDFTGLPGDGVVTPSKPEVSARP